MLMKLTKGVFLTIIMFGCLSSPTNEARTWNLIKVADDKRNLELTDFKAIEFYPLGQELALPTFELTRGKNFQGVYAFADGYLQGNILLTDSVGNLLHRINHLGDDPFSYKELTDFRFVDQELIEVYDFKNQVFKRYTFEGDFQSKNNVGYNFRNYFVSQEGHYLFTAKHANYINGISKNYDLIHISDDGNLLRQSFPFKEEDFLEVRMHSVTPFVAFRDELYFKDVLSDTMYQINQGMTLEPKFIFEFASPLNADMTANGHKILVDKMVSRSNDISDKSFGVQLAAISDEFITYTYISNFQKCHGVYSRKSRKIKQFRANNDARISLLDAFFIDGDQFVVVVPYFVLADLYQGNEPSELRQLNNNDPERSILVKYQLNDL